MVATTNVEKDDMVTFDVTKNLTMKTVLKRLEFIRWLGPKFEKLISDEVKELKSLDI